MMNELFTFLSNRFGIVHITMWAISVLSTITERLLLLAACILVLTAIVWASRSMAPSRLKSLLPSAFAFLIFAGLYVVFPFTEYPFPVTGYLFPGDHPYATAFVLALLIGAYGLYTERRERLSGISVPVIRWIAVLFLVCGAAVTLLNGWALRKALRTLHSDPLVWQFARGDYNWIELDSQRGFLFAVGHGVNRLHAFNVSALDQPPMKTDVDITGAQAFAFDPVGNELHVPQVSTGSLLIIDSNTLRLKTSIPSLGLPQADTFLAWDKATGKILVAAEEAEGGSPTVVVDRNQRKVAYASDLSAYNLFKHPKKPWVYLAVDGEHHLVAYDLSSGKVKARADLPSRYLERMALSPNAGELLVAMPVLSSVMRLDARTLAIKGPIDTVLGVRAVAVDSRRGWLFTGSLVSSNLEILDLDSGARVAKFYVGPWLRTICLDEGAGVAYVSSIEGISRIQYGGLS